MTDAAAVITDDRAEDSIISETLLDFVIKEESVEEISAMSADSGIDEKTLVEVLLEEYGFIHQGSEEGAEDSINNVFCDELLKEELTLVTSLSSDEGSEDKSGGINPLGP